MPNYRIENVSVTVNGPVYVTAPNPEAAQAVIQMGTYDKGAHAASQESDYDIVSYGDYPVEVAP